MKRMSAAWLSSWSAAFAIVAAIAIGWRAEFIHAESPALFVLAPYYLMGVDDAPPLLPFLLAQALYFTVLATLSRWIWRQIFGT